MNILTLSNPKLIKGEAYGWLSAVCHLAPYNLSGRNVCPHASAGCAAACLNTAGRGRFENIQSARIRKTVRFFEDRKGWLADLDKDIGALVRKADREGMRPAVRLNGTSDIPWERTAPEIFERWSEVQFYDYTKIPGRRDLPANYHLTFSRSECNHATAQAEFKAGRNVAVVFAMPLSVAAEWAANEFGWRTYVVDGDFSDLRFRDPAGSIIYLKAKGDAKRDVSGFVIGA